MKIMFAMSRRFAMVITVLALMLKISTPNFTFNPFMTEAVTI